MYKTKKEIDAHVRSALCKIRNETERNLRSFTIAKLYYKINEYSSAEQYLSAYLTVKDDNDQAHKLLGQCYLRLKKFDKALVSFQRSLQINPKQPEILAEVCQLLINENALNINAAKYWCDLAEAEKVQHDAVFSLRLLLLNKNNKSDQVEEVIQKEISARPNDVGLRVRLVRYYIEQNKILDAFKYIYNFEMTTANDLFDSSEWYNIVWLVLNKYEQLPHIKKDWEFWLLLLICLERQIYISFTGNASTLANSGTTETANLLFNLDQYLYKISQVSDTLNQQKELVLRCINHYAGQMLLHAASLLFKREIIHRKNKWKETIKSALPLLLIAYQCDTPNTKELWMKHSDENGKRLIHLWNREGAFRCVQVGRTLFSCIFDDDVNENSISLQRFLGNNQRAPWANSDEIILQIKQICSDKTWRHNIFSLLYCNSDQKIKEQTSFLIRNSKLNEPRYEMPTYAEVEGYEESAQYLKPESLQHIVYLCLGNTNLAYVRSKFFTGLNFSTQNLSFCGAESLNQLDMDTFLYATTIQAKRMLQVENDTYESYNSENIRLIGKPCIMPFVNLQLNLCTEEQSAWWSAAYKVYKNFASDSLSELRATLQNGIEAVRGINGPKMDIIIAFKLGQILTSRSEYSGKPSEKLYLEARSENIYKHGLNMLKMNNKGVLEPYCRYFKYIRANSSIVEREVNQLAEDAVTLLAGKYFKKGEYEELVDELNGVQLPFATYLQSEAYCRLEEANKTPNKVKRIYLQKATECLNETLTLLKSSHADPNHPLNSMVHTELRRLQQATNKFINNVNQNSNNNTHNGSSSFEDADNDYCAGDSLQNRSRLLHDSQHTTTTARNVELENICRQMATTLTFVKEEICDTIKPEMMSLKKEIAYLKDKMISIEDIMRKKTMTSNSPSRDDEASNVLDDFYIIEDALQNQIFSGQSQQQSQTNQPTSTNLYGASLQQQQQHQSSQQQFQPQRIQTPNTMQMQQTVNAAAAAVVAAAYNNPLYNPNYPVNYYPPSYMMTPQQAAGAALGTQIGQRNNQLALPYMDSAMNYNITTPLLPPPSNDINRPANLFGLFTQQPPQQQQQQQQQPLAVVAPPLSATGATETTQPPPLIPAGGEVAPPPSLPPPQVSHVMQPPSIGAIPFSKTHNNAPVEKGPPANVVITHSDPLPINNGSLQSQPQQPTLSVTIPSHHIKQSAVAAVSDGGSPFSTNSPFQSFTGLGPSINNTTFAHLGATGATGATVTLPVSNCTSNSTTKFSMQTSVFSSANSTISSIIAPVKAVSPQTFSFKPQIAQAKQDAEQEQYLLNKTSESVTSEHNKSEPEIEYDPRPDFQPIIPLPPEIEIKTGEEDETVIFCARCKLYRHIDKEWKERGIGDIKILKSKTNGSRILMRRDQTHKICANHKITNDIVITKTKNDERSYMWAANDFADEELKLEKFLIRFKLAETAKDFYDSFVQAKKEDNDPEIEVGINKFVQPSEAVPLQKTALNFATNKTSTPAAKIDTTPSKEANSFSSKPLQVSLANETSTLTVSKSLFNSAPVALLDSGKQQNKSQSPFAAFSFNIDTSNTTGAYSPTQQPFSNILSNLPKTTMATSAVLTPIGTPTFTFTAGNTGVDGDLTSKTLTPHNKSATSDNEDEYVSTAQFKPVIPLPDLIEVTTGEENETVLFEHRAKLLRFDKTTNEWKERGLGNIKILQDKDDFNKVRLVMRREIVHKLCCNQRLYKDTVFKYAKNSETALMWAGQDYSENELQVEMLTIRFKTADICKNFYDVIEKAQSNMSSEAEKDQVEKVDKLERMQNMKQKEEQENTVKETAKGFGNLFKPKPGSWNCEACYTTNTCEQSHCAACQTPKDSTAPKKELPSGTTSTPFSFGFPNTSNIPLSTNTVPSSFSFGSKPPMLSSANTSTPPASSLSKSATQKDLSTTGNSFGDAFRPKEGSWSCKGCYLTNDGSAQYCKACEAPKDDTVPKKESQSNILASSNPAMKFNFGFAPKAPIETSNEEKPFSFNVTKTEAATKSFSFNTAAYTTESNLNAFNFTQSVPSSTSSDAVNLSMNISKPTFSFSMGSKINETAQQQQKPFQPLEKKEFSFVLKSKSPGGKARSPNKSNSVSDDIGDADNGDYNEEEEEEENNAYFTPVIPLPDKVDVKTGEEDEDVLYSVRSKLYRFVDSEWKERGLGDAKILRHKETKKLRVVMRRDQIYKICLNHVLNDSVQYKRKDDKSWLFVVNDYSEGELELEKFSLRFKTKEIAEDFMNAVKKALNGDDQAQEAETNLAKELQLPLNFFESSKDPCSGCIGCDSDSFVFPENKESNEKKDNSPLPLQMPEVQVPANNRSIMMKASLLTPSSVKNAPEIKSDTVLSASSPKASITTFSFTKAIKDSIEHEDNKSASGGFLFGNSSGGNFFGSTYTGNSVFGEKHSIFGRSSVAPLKSDLNTATKSVFDNTSTFSDLSSNYGAGSSMFDASVPTATVGKSEEVISIFGGAVNTSSAPKSILGGSMIASNYAQSTFSAAPTVDNIEINTTSTTTVAPPTTIFGVGGSFLSKQSENKPAFGEKPISFGKTSIIANTGNAFKFSSGNATEQQALNFAPAKNTSQVTSFADLAKTSGAVDFAALSAKSNDSTLSNQENEEKITFLTKPIDKEKQKSEAIKFYGLTNNDAFSNFKNPQQQLQSSTTRGQEEQESSETNADNDENYDPHYEPIISLPNEIVLATGEEEETKLFGERATLFRYDDSTKEWKERGVGELKILQHNVHGSYRLLMRRDQVHKLVLNHAVGEDFSFDYMKKNQKSFVWAAMNYAENNEQPETEKLAVRFRTVCIAKKFETTLKKCIEKVIERSAVTT